MLCDKCKSNKATIHIKQNINGSITEYDLCDKCAAEMDMMNEDLSFGGLLGGFFNEFGNTHRVQKSPYISACETCGLSFDEFISNGRMGCPDCYNTFRENLKGILKNIQGSTKHTGKGSDEARRIKTEEAPKELTEEERLKNELDIAVKAEEYEKAAQIRDKLRELRGKGDN